jgi:TPR repeat protein
VRSFPARSRITSTPRPRSRGVIRRSSLERRFAWRGMAWRSSVKVAEQGDAGAQFRLGVMYAFGLGVPQDYAETVKWWRRAAEQGNIRAQPSLGNMYRNGVGVPQNYAEALRWYRLAAEQGNADAQFALGVMYEKGEGVPKDYILVHMWFNLAVSRGSSSGTKNRDIVAGFMTRAQIAEAQQRAWEWKPKIE